jgi:polysaccharide chain length determinant protein (PEP-CTERM system associated)
MPTKRRKRQINLEYIVNLIWKKRFLVLIPLTVSLASGLLLSFLMPKIYEARTMILVEPQRVPGEYVRAIVPQDIRSRIGTITQQILSRSNLEKVIENFQLFPDQRPQQAFMEDKLETLRDQISVRVSRAHGGAEAFSISYRGDVPETVMQVANTLTTLFIESNLQVREEQAQGTSSFLDDELENMRTKLARIESELQNYRQRHMGELPEQLDSNLKMLETFRIQLEERKERLRNERNRIMTADNEIEQLKANAEKGRKEAPLGTSKEAENPDGNKLDQLKDELKSLQSAYTDKHPNVIRLKKKIEALEKEPPEKTGSPGEKSGTLALPAESSISKILAERQRQRTMIISSVNSLQEDINKIDRQIKDYQQRIERTPKREEEMLGLKRDYQNIQETYKSLLSRKLEADMAVNMERKKKGEQFQVLDYAKLPEKPISPNLKKIFLLTLVVGISMGIGLTIVLDAMDETVRSVTDMESLGLPMIAAIPECITPKIARRTSRRNIATVCSITTVFALTGVFAYVAMLGGF